MYGKGMLIFRSICAFLWNAASIALIWFFVQGVITSISLEMGEYAWIWAVLAVIFLISLLFSIRFTALVVGNWRALRKENP